MRYAMNLLREYMGTGLIFVWYLICQIYLFCKEKRKNVRILFLYIPTVLLVLFFVPVFSRLMTEFMGTEIYYRILWLLPVTVVTAYAAVLFCMSVTGKKRKAAIGFVVFLTLMSGKYVYSNVYFSRAENLYHVPDPVVHICDAIEIPGREVTAVVPLEMIQYVRQYSPVVCLPYGREILVESWNEWAVRNDLCDAMEAEELDAALLGALARQQACVYIVVSGQKPMDGSLEDTGYALFDTIDGYLVYKDVYFQP